MKRQKNIAFQGRKANRATKVYLIYSIYFIISSIPQKINDYTRKGGVFYDIHYRQFNKHTA